MIDVERPAQVPASLAARKSYRDPDVLETLHVSFRQKCYLCESRVVLGAFEVDHRRPKGDARFAHLEHEWTNLFPVCVTFRCNQRRKRYPEGDLVSPGDGVEARIVQEVQRLVSPALSAAGTTAFVFRSARADDVPALNTAIELNWIHNGPGFQAPQLRGAILGHVGALEPGMHLYDRLSRDPAADAELIARQKQWVVQYIGRDAPYTMLVRSYFSRLDAVRALFD